MTDDAAIDISPACQGPNDAALNDSVESPPVDVPPHAIYRWLNPRNPHLAKRRVGNVFTKAWRHLALSSFLLTTGIILLCVGIACLWECMETNRAMALFVVGSVTFIPGSYGMYILWSYVRCSPGYSWRMLPVLD